MKTFKINNRTTLVVNQSLEGETLEEKVMRIVENNEPITDGAPIVYTDRKEGVMPAYNVRTDRWDVAIDAMDKVSASRMAKREEYLSSRDNLKGDDVGPTVNTSDPVK